MKLKMKISNSENIFVLMGIFVSLVFWTLESALHIYVFRIGTSFVEEFFNPTYHELVMRLVIVALFISFSFYAKHSITKIKRAKKKLEHTHAELNQIFNAAADGMRVVDRNFNMSCANKTFSELVKMDDARMKNKKCYDVFPGDDCHTPKCPLTQIVKHGRSHVEHDIRKVDSKGTEVYCIVTAAPFLGPDGKVLGIVEDFRDITSRRQMEKALYESEEKLEIKVEEKTEELKKTHRKLLVAEKLAALGKMASTIAHELRNPLGVIKLAVYSLKKKIGSTKPNTLKHLKNIDKEITESNRIIHDLLMFSKSPELRIETVGVNKVIKNLVEENKYCIKGYKFKIVDKLDSGLPKIKADPYQLSEAICNIILNAAQAMEESEKKLLTIESRVEDGFVEIKISDTGPGISKENISRLGEPFFSTKIKGIGLGLFITYQIIEKHKGNIRVESSDKGTIFIIKLPI